MAVKTPRKPRQKRPVDPAPPAPTDRTTKPAWVALEVYNAFVMGGNVWQWVRFQVPCIEVTIERREIVVLAYEVEGRWHVHEKRTGGRMAGGKTLEAAMAKVHKDVDRTPDLEDQIAKMPEPTKYREMSLEDATRYLRKMND